jgi:CBS domain-containing protein
VQLNVSHTKLADLHPADIADILEQLDLEEAGAMLERLDMETAADTLNEVEYPLQSELLSELDPERASDLLERLAPDDAADILADIPHEEAERLLNLMPTNEAQPIRDLLRYGAQTAGGIMTSEVLALPLDATVDDALIRLRQNSSHLEMIYYLYTVDEEQHLRGVVSLRQLVTAEPGARMHDLMNPDVIKVQIDADQEEVARVIAKYDLLAVPVVDAENHLAGMVTVDDVIDVIHEEQAEDFSEIAGADVEEAHFLADSQCHCRIRPGSGPVPQLCLALLRQYGGVRLARGGPSWSVNTSCTGQPALPGTDALAHQWQRLFANAGYRWLEAPHQTWARFPPGLFPRIIVRNHRWYSDQHSRWHRRLDTVSGAAAERGDWPRLRPDSAGGLHLWYDPAQSLSAVASARQPDSRSFA